MIPEFLLAFTYLVALMVTGFGASRWILRSESRLQAEYWLPVSFALGAGIQSIVFLISIAVFGRIYPVLFPLTGALLLASTFVPRAPVLAMEEYHGFQIVLGPENDRLRSIYWLGVVLLFLSFAFLFQNAMSYPMASYDGRAIWNFKAKILFHEKTVFTEAFLEPLRVHYHRDYPLMVPFAEYGLYEFVGRVNEDMVRFFFSTLMMMSVFFTFAIVQSATGRTTALFFAVVVAAMPFRPDWMVTEAGGPNSGESDVPLSFFAMIGIISYFRWWKDGSFSMLLMGSIFTAFCLMTKKEGLVIFTLLLCVNGLQLLFGKVPDRRLAFKSLVLANTITVLLIVPWLVVAQGLPNYYDEDYFAMMTMDTFRGAPTRFPVIWALFTNDVTTIDKWSFMWLVFWVTMILRFRSWFRERAFYLDAIIIIWIIGYFIVYMISPLNLVFHVNTSLRRLLAHMFPIVVLQCAFMFAHLSDPGRGRE